jgi:hypothetical protein
LRPGSLARAAGPTSRRDLRPEAANTPLPSGVGSWVGEETDRNDGSGPLDRDARADVPRAPAWQETARLIDPRSTSTVYFQHRPDEPWRLERRGDDTLLLPGAAEDPDFVFRFTPGAIARLAAVRGNAGDFAAELFSMAWSDDPAVRVNIRIACGFARLLRRGYVRYCSPPDRARARSPPHTAWTGMSSIQHLVATMRKIDRAGWEEQSRGSAESADGDDDEHESLTSPVR